MTRLKQVQIPPSARQIAERLRQALQVDLIYLFGSYAKGEAGPDSDLDIAVIVPESRETRYRRNVQARSLVGDIHVAKDIVVLTRREWDDEQGIVCSLANTVAREGIRLDG